ncbi:MAG: exosortase system-associated protein, TIGR04073 family [Candidatus Sumerlaeia bacterium]|nr:exosortase system-associated protein, TIGR04073 family [Candidatus Sumerlaeia bacterium]
MRCSSPKKLLLAGALCLTALVANPGVADARGPLYGSTYPSKITGKLWGGVSNVLFCWMEVPIEINREIQKTDPFTGTVVGFGQGIYYTGKRFWLGTVDAVTFPVDLYKNNYQSVQRSEFPFIDEVE